MKSKAKHVGFIVLELSVISACVVVLLGMKQEAPPETKDQIQEKLNVWKNDEKKVLERIQVESLGKTPSVMQYSNRWLREKSPTIMPTGLIKPDQWASNEFPSVQPRGFDSSYLPPYMTSYYDIPSYFSTMEYVFRFGFDDQMGAVMTGGLQMQEEYYNAINPKGGTGIKIMADIFEATQIVIPFDLAQADGRQLDLFCQIHGHNQAAYRLDSSSVMCSGSSGYKIAHAYDHKAQWMGGCPSGYVLDPKVTLTSMTGTPVMACRLAQPEAFIPAPMDLRCPRGYRDTAFDVPPESLTLNEWIGLNSPSVCVLEDISKAECPQGFERRQKGCYPALLKTKDTQPYLAKDQSGICFNGQWKWAWWNDAQEHYSTYRMNDEVHHTYSEVKKDTWACEK